MQFVSTSALDEDAPEDLKTDLGETLQPWNDWTHRQLFWILTQTISLDNEISGCPALHCFSVDASAGAISRRERHAWKIRSWRGANTAYFVRVQRSATCSRSSQPARSRSVETLGRSRLLLMIRSPKTSDDIKAWCSSGDVKSELPTALDSSHRVRLDNLKSLRGRIPFAL